jgi:phospholipid/cholesterol/gamma-HCH transport system substrate-binding protein
VPSQKQLKWSQLKVGITVLVASVVLAILILLMSGTGGIFTHKMTLISYFDNAGGLREGAPVRLQGVDIGNVTKIMVVSDPARQRAPVQVTMKVITKYLKSIRKDSVTTLSTAGVLGETYIDIDSSQAKGLVAQEDDVMTTRESPQIEDVVRASQSTLQNMDSLLKRVDRIVAFVESGQGSIGKMIYDNGLYNQLNATVAQMQSLVAQVANGKGSIGKLLVDDKLYNSANDTIDKLNKIVDDIRAGKGTAGKFLTDSTLYDNANKTMASVKQMTDDINAGKGAIGVMARDQEFAEKLKKTMANVSELTAELNNPTGSVGKLLRDPALYDNTNDLMVKTKELINAMRENPKKYLTIHVKIF